MASVAEHPNFIGRDVHLQSCSVGCDRLRQRDAATPAPTMPPTCAEGANGTVAATSEESDGDSSGVLTQQSCLLGTVLVDMSVKEEGSRWWTSNSDETDSSAWAGNAQCRVAELMPSGFDSWAVSNEFHSLIDESQQQRKQKVRRERKRKRQSKKK